MEENKEAKRLRVMYILLAIAPQIGIGIIVVVWLFQVIFIKEPDPLDNDINRTRRLVDKINVVDSTHNGFQIVYATVHDVSEGRLEEIRKRPLVNEGFKRLKLDAPLHFGNMVTTDIYDFADFALRYDLDSDVKMNSIFVFGKEKSELYIGPNPNIDNPARWMNSSTRQGVLYINEDDIYYHGRTGIKVYRYWRCYGMNSTSSTDEHFSHFSEDERVR